MSTKKRDQKAQIKSPSKVKFSTKFPTLLSAHGDRLAHFIKCAKRLARNCPEAAAIQKITFALMLGVEEILQQGPVGLGLGGWDFSKLDSSEDSYERCYSIAEEIYKTLKSKWGANRTELFKHYKEIWVFLNRSDSKWLREKILLGQVKATDIVRWDKKDFQSEQEKKRLEMQEEKFIQEEEKIVIKTHKGEEEINTEEKDELDQNENETTIVTKFAQSVRKVKEDTIDSEEKAKPSIKIREEERSAFDTDSDETNDQSKD
ncbi:unnamed protein product [Moneuplotes crassus]|uniref:Uncharacterized protein n=1 Tax=Euplotes crassus TaxID=5936 RepID=A0AAD1Y5N5_EUPCR|nr:unnamed protein product [Moneuplotes crassus]